ncbi:MAG: PKD domain-containing protein [Cytophagales bacterium]|nr:PKD domain-containing protein [Bernardetiaceae bacterium]MDW8210836.1 PKD domain-containing protein [Cytophagales bacterium]
MKKLYVALAASWCITASLQAGEGFGKRLQASEHAYWFTENKGQWEEIVQYRAEIPAGFFFLLKDGLHWAFYDQWRLYELKHGRELPNRSVEATRVEASSSHRQGKLIDAHGVRVHFIGANPQVHLHGLLPSSTLQHYFIGSQEERWAKEVRSYAEVRYQSIYPGIHLRVFTHNTALKYEFAVTPHANPRQIAMQYEGATLLQLQANGNLKVATPLQTIIEYKPYCFQIIQGKEVEVPSRFVLHENTLQFDFPEGYNPDYELIIDPQLVFSTYSGSLSDNWGNCATFDAEGNTYTGGTIFGRNFPVTVGAFQVQFGGLVDVAVQKFSPDGRNLLFSTYLGGSSAESPHSMIVNKQNQLIIFGTTSSANFPTTAGAFDRTFNGGVPHEPIGGIDYPAGSDIFISILNNVGSQLIASTFVGGTGNDGVNLREIPGITLLSPLVRNYGDELRGEVVVDSRDNVYIASCTRSTNFPVRNAFASSLSGPIDGVVFRMNPTLTSLEWGTYLGGNGYDAAYSLRVASTGEVLVCGGTTSTSFPITSGALQSTYAGATDGFVVRFSATGGLLNSTFLGTPNFNQAYLLDLDQENNVYVFGTTVGAYPVTAGVYSNPNSGQFIHALPPTLNRTIFSTVVGTSRGRPDLSPTAFLVNECGNIYFAGWGGFTNNFPPYPGSQIGQETSITGMPVTPDAIKTTAFAGDDFYIGLLSPNARSLIYGTYIGGNSVQDGDHVDGGTSRFDKNGIIYHAVCACRSNNFPTTPTAWATINRAAAPNIERPSGGCNNAAFKIDIDELRAAFITTDAAGNPTKELCAPADFRFINRSTNATRFSWEIRDLATGNVIFTARTRDTRYVFPNEGRYAIQLTAENDIICRPARAFDTVRVRPGQLQISSPVTICRGQSVQLFADTRQPNSTYTWTPAVGLSNPNIANPIARPLQTTTYRLRASAPNGCTYDTAVTVTVRNVEADFTVQLADPCNPATLVRLINNSTGGERFEWDLGDGRTLTERQPPLFRYQRPGTYRIILTVSEDGCTSRDTAVVQISNQLAVSLIAPPTICSGESVQLFASGGERYTWTPSTGLSNPNIPNPIASPQQTTRYNLRVESAGGCVRDTFIVITVVPRPVARFSTAVEGQCQPSPLLRITNNGINNGETYLWDFGDGRTFEGFQPPPQRYAASGRYLIRLTVRSGPCIARDSAFVDINVFNPAEFRAGVRLSPSAVICSNESIQLFASGGTRYQWTPATGLSNPNIANPVARPSQTTRYQVRIFSAEGCFIDTAVTVEVSPAISIDFDVITSAECGSPGTVQIINRTANATNFQWSLGNGQTFTGPTPGTITYPQSGIYRITLQASNRACSASRTVEVPVENISPPNVITPNGDGKNDFFVINNIRQGWRLQIYNRWGRLVFQSDSYGNDWKGEGISATYFYLLTSPEGRTCRGWVQVITEQ